VLVVDNDVRYKQLSELFNDALEQTDDSEVGAAKLITYLFYLGGGYE
jgi:hypothetical protein